MESRRLAVTAPASSSSVARPPTVGKVFIEKAAILEDLIADSSQYAQSRKKYVRTEIIDTNVDVPLTKTNGTRRSPTLPASSSPPVDLKRSKKDGNPHADAVALLREKREKAFPIILANVDRATSFLDEVDREMELANEAKRNKTRRQFEEWNTNVHGEIQKRVQGTVGQMDSKQLNRKKNEDYKKFLTVTNRKPAIFRDIIIESEYDPLEPNRRCVKAKTGKLNDPVKVSEIKAQKEASMLGTSAKGVLQAKQTLGKDTLSVEQWAAGKIEATPYGTFAKMMSTKGGADDSPSQKSLTMQSHIHFDHFAFPRGRDAIEAEMPKGKRIYPEVVYSDPARVFGGLPESFAKELAAIKPVESRRPF